MVTTNISELTPGTLEKKGIAYAPRTLASLVYMDDGTTVADNIEDLMVDGKRFLMKTATRQLQVELENQRVYDIPIPVEKYNYDKFPLIIAHNGVMIESSNYRINDNQLIFTEEFCKTIHRDDILMFIFHYLDIIVEDFGLDAEYINNVRFFVSKDEPKCKQTTDVWFDTTQNQVKQFNGEEWEIIVDGNSKNGSTLAVYKSSVTLEEPSRYVNIGIEEFDFENDLLFVYQNSVYLEKDQDYSLDDSTKIHCLNGEWCDNNQPQIFNFIVLKNVIEGYEGIDGQLLLGNSVSKEKLSPELIEFILESAGSQNSGVADSVEGANVIQTPEFRLVTDALIKKWNDYENTIAALTDKIRRFEELIEQNTLVVNMPTE